MQIGVLSDTHFHTSQEKLPAKVIKALSNVDLIVHCGDFCEYFVFEDLEKICSGEVVGVYGNMDAVEIREALPERVVFECESHQIGVIHGNCLPRGIEEHVQDIFWDVKGIDVILYGHTHAPSNHVVDDILFFNPGSPTDKRYAKYNSYGILTVTESKVFGEIVRL